MRRLCLVALILLCSALLLAQTGSRAGWVWVSDGDSFRLRPLNGVMIAPDGSPYVSTPGSVKYIFGPGLATSGANPVYVTLDTAFVLYRTPSVPPGPGGCQLGTGAIAADPGHMYICVPAPPGTSGTEAFIWARVPMETTW